jgi:hypothetical protein
MKAFTVQITFANVPDLKQVARVTNQLRTGTSARRMATKIAREYAPEGRSIQVKTMDSPKLFALFVDDIYMAVVRIETISYAEYHELRSDILDSMEAHRPIALEGELLISAAPKGTYEPHIPDYAWSSSNNGSGK